MKRKANVFMFDRLAGTLSQNGEQYIFLYEPNYSGIPVSLSLPLRDEPYIYNGRLHPYFESLAPEGWLRAIYSEQQHIDIQDSFGFLLENGEDLIGAIQIRPVNDATSCNYID